MHLHPSEREEIKASQAFMERLLEESIAKLEEESPEQDNFVRWELGACWIQHLQDQKNAEKDKKPSHEKAKNEMKVEGLGTPLRSLKNKKKKMDGSNQKMLSENVNAHSTDNSENAISASELEASAKENELALKEMLTEAAFARLKESDTGLHLKVTSIATIIRGVIFFPLYFAMRTKLPFIQQSLQELVNLSHKYYVDVALPKLVITSYLLIYGTCCH